MNIYEMIAWIRQNDSSFGRVQTQIADFLQTQHMCRRIESEAFFFMLKDLMINVINSAPYSSENMVE